MNFIAGPHHCIGRQMSIWEMKFVIIALIGNFKFDYAEPGQQIIADSAITMKVSRVVCLRLVFDGLVRKLTFDYPYLCFNFVLSLAMDCL